MIIDDDDDDLPYKMVIFHGKALNN